MMSSIMEMMPSIDMSTILALALIIIPVAVVLALLFARRTLRVVRNELMDEIVYIKRRLAALETGRRPPPARIAAEDWQIIE